MKILYITYEGFDTPNPNNQMAEVMISGFLDKGYYVHLIQSHRKGLNADIPLSLINRDTFTCDIIKRTPVDKSKFIKRYFNDLKYVFSSIKYWRRMKDVDVIYCQSSPTIVFMMILLRLFRKEPIIYSIYDIFPGHAMSVGVINNKFVYYCLKWLQKPCYKLARMITVLSEDMKDEVQRLGARSERIKVVPAWFDTSKVREIELKNNRFIQKYNINTNKFIIQFAGTIGYVFNYYTIIELAKNLQHEDWIVFQIVGDGSRKDAFIDEAKRSDLNNIEFYPLQPVELVPDVYSACNLCIIPLCKDVIWSGVPSKAPILMACRRVIINSVEIESKYARMIKENDIGVVTDMDDIEGLTATVIKLAKSPDLIRNIAEKAYHFSHENYSSTKSIHILCCLFESLCNKRE